MFSVLSPLIFWSLQASLLVGPPPIMPQDPDSTIPASQPGDIQLALGDAAARLTVPVALGNKGPYPFIIDTGAERTVVSHELARTLALLPGAPITVTSMTGRNLVDTVVVPELAIQSIGEPHRIIAPAFAAANLGAAGLLGIDTLSRHQVTIDFDTGTMQVRPSTPRKRHERHAPDEIIVTAKSLFGQLIVTDAFYAGNRIRVVLDTGSQVTMGNSAFRRLVHDRSPPEPIRLTGVTGDTLQAEYSQVPDVRIGEIAFGTLPVAFADVEPFRRFGLTKKPAVLLGMDAMRSFRRIEIDFPNRQVRFLMPPEARRPRRPSDWDTPFRFQTRNDIP